MSLSQSHAQCDFCLQRVWYFIDYLFWPTWSPWRYNTYLLIVYLFILICGALHIFYLMYKHTLDNATMISWADTSIRSEFELVAWALIHDHKWLWSDHEWIMMSHDDPQWSMTDHDCMCMVSKDDMDIHCGSQVSMRESAYFSLIQ